MNKPWSSFGGTIVALALALGASAQTNPVSPPPIESRPVVVPPSAPPERGTLPARPERPAVPGKPVPSKDMKDLVQDFQNARESFRKQQLELNRQLKSASEEQRAVIRQQIQENIQQWLEQQKALTAELREQAKEMADEHKNLDEVIKSGTSGGGRPRR